MKIPKKIKQILILKRKKTNKKEKQQLLKIIIKKKKKPFRNEQRTSLLSCLRARQLLV